MKIESKFKTYISKKHLRITGSQKLIKEIDCFIFISNFWVILLHFSGVFKNNSILIFSANFLNIISNKNHSF